MVVLGTKIASLCVLSNVRRREQLSSEGEASRLPRRVFLGMLGAGGALVVAGSTVEKILGGSLLGTSVGLGGYHIYTVGPGYPAIDPTSYRLVIQGGIKQPMALSLQELKGLGFSELKATFHCVTGWEVPNQIFGGVPLYRVINAAGPNPEARFVNFYSLDGIYTETLSMADAMNPSTMVVTHLDRSPLSVEHGAPVRLFVDGMYGYKSIKWLGKIELSPKPITGYWENYGYPADAQIT